jgi:hypothetical protein
MRKLCTSQGWAEPEEGFTVAPVNSSAALFHWRCLIVLLSLLLAFQREEFRTNGRVTGDVEQSIDTEDGMVPIVYSSEDDFTGIDVSYASNIEVNNPAAYGRLLQEDLWRNSSLMACHVNPLRT